MIGDWYNSHRGHRGHREFNNNLATDFTDYAEKCSHELARIYLTTDTPLNRKGTSFIDCADFVLAAEEKQIEFNIGNLCVLSVSPLGDA